MSLRGTDHVGHLAQRTPDDAHHPPLPSQQTCAHQLVEMKNNSLHARHGACATMGSFHVGGRSFITGPWHRYQPVLHASPWPSRTTKAYHCLTSCARALNGKRFSGRFTHLCSTILETSSTHNRCRPVSNCHSSLYNRRHKNIRSATQNSRLPSQTGRVRRRKRALLTDC
jgi:hypothetical protein